MKIYATRRILSKYPTYYEIKLLNFSGFHYSYKASTTNPSERHINFYIYDGADISTCRLNDPNVVYRTLWEF